MKTERLLHFEKNVYANYRNAKTVSELAVLCNYNQIKTFTRHFKKIFGQSPYQWMLDRKFEEIQHLVLNTNISISDISETYKFENLSHFCNSYRKRYGITPTKHRDTYSKK